MATIITIQGAKKLDNGLFNISNTHIFVRNESGKIVDRYSGLHHITPKGWESKKPVIVELDVVSLSEEESAEDENELFYDVVITEKCLEYLVSNYTGGKYWLGTAEQQAIHRSQCAYNSLAKNLHDPEL